MSQLDELDEILEEVEESTEVEEVEDPTSVTTELPSGEVVLQSTASLIDQLGAKGRVFGLSPVQMEEALPEEYEVRSGKVWVSTDGSTPSEQTSLTDLKMDIIRRTRQLPASSPGAVARDLGCSESHVRRAQEEFRPFLYDDVLFEYFVEGRGFGESPTDTHTMEALPEEMNDVDREDARLSEGEEDSDEEHEVVVSDEEEMFHVLAGLIEAERAEMAAELFGRWG